ncbi:hypothetical protein C2845_PM07G35170 [Panicum miliaceum]|uniref:Uncharacterized protein n=1 Tax=Panicum miliaceum TaxID=4540 RepID=A0A3L6SLC2_PANMI|nr:hypothetical protein C2845_PM07G35170 [Panicum miliaceum]
MRAPRRRSRGSLFLFGKSRSSQIAAYRNGKTSEELGENSAAGVPAGGGLSVDEARAVKGARSAGLGAPCRRHSAPLIFPSPDPLHGVRPGTSGSRFWALSGEESSEEEESAGEEASHASGESISSSDFIRDALLAGFSVDEVRGAEALATNGISPRFGSVSGGAGHAKHHRFLAQRIVDAVAERRSPAVKPWRGPLPKRRISPSLSLGDIPVTDRRSKKSGRRGSKEVVRIVESSLAGHGREAAALGSTAVAEEHEEEQFGGVTGKSSGWAGPSEWAVSGGVPAHKRFGSSRRIKFAEGLGRLFRNGGRPRSFLYSSSIGGNHILRESKGLERRQQVEIMFRGYGGGSGRGRRGDRAFGYERQREIVNAASGRQGLDNSGGEVQERGRGRRSATGQSDWAHRGNLNQDLFGLKEKVQQMNKEEFLAFLKEQAGQILDVAVDRTLDMVVDKVLAEREEDHSQLAVGAGSDNLVISDQGREGNQEGAQLEEMVENNDSAQNSLLAGNKGADSEFQNAAAIPEALVSPPRSSPRLVKSADVHVLLKAERKAAEKNLEGSKAG